MGLKVSWPMGLKVSLLLNVCVCVCGGVGERKGEGREFLYVVGISSAIYLKHCDISYYLDTITFWEYFCKLRTYNADSDWSNLG